MTFEAIMSKVTLGILCMNIILDQIPDRIFVFFLILVNMLIFMNLR